MPRSTLGADLRPSAEGAAVAEGAIAGTTWAAAAEAEAGNDADVVRDGFVLDSDEEQKHLVAILYRRKMEQCGMR